MFCTKCGTKLEANTTVCPKCGNDLSTRAGGAKTTPAAAHNGARHATTRQPNTINNVKFAAPTNGGTAAATIGRASTVNRGGAIATATRSAVKTARSSAGSFTATGILSRVAGVGALACMFLPWLEIPAMRTLGQYASYLNIRVSAETSYPMYDMDNVTRTLDLLSSSNAYSGLQSIFFFFWIVALALLVIGLILSFTGKKSSRALIPGAIVLAIVAFLWFASISALDAEYARQLAQLIGNRVQFFVIPPAVGGAILTSVACTILAIADKR